MARAHRFAALASVLSLVYILAAFSVLSVPLVSKDVADQLIPVVPWWLLVSFGSYSLGTLGWGLFTFRDCPEAYNELLAEISEAKDDLRGKGVTVD